MYLRSYVKFVSMCVQFCYSIMLIFWYNITEDHSGFLPRYPTSEWESIPIGQWDFPAVYGFRMPNAVDWRSIHHYYTGLGKAHTSCETVHDFWVRARVYIDTFLSDIWLGLNTVYTHNILQFSYFLLGNEPIRGSHFSSFLHILSLKQYNGWISIKSIKTKIILY